MNAEELATLEAAAKAATPGPWFVVHTDDDSYMNAVYVGTIDRGPRHDGDLGADPHSSRAGEIVAMTLLQSPPIVCHDSERWDEDARYIAAASPDVVLPLVAALREARAERDEHQASVGALGRAVLAGVEAELRLTAERDALAKALALLRLDHEQVTAGWNNLHAHKETLLAERSALRAERDELAAEVEAFMGKPEGALPGWAAAREGMSALYERVKPGSGWFALVTPARRQHTWYISGDDGKTEGGHAVSPRAAMRAAEAAARARGWMP